MASATEASNAFYVSTHGSDAPGGGSNTCTNKAEPCATVEHALAEQAAVNPSSVADPAFNVINVAKGVYAPQPAITCAAGGANNNVNIIGARETKVKVNIDTLSADATPSLVDFSNCTGATIEDLEIINDGAGSAGLAGVYLCTNDTANSIHLLGELPIGVDEGCNNGTLSNSVLVPTLCTATTKAGADITGTLAEGWGFPANVKVNKIPKCATGDLGTVDINGVSYTYTISATPKTIVLTGGGPAGTAVASGTVIAFGSSDAAFLQVGDECSDVSNCIITNNIITGGGGPAVADEFGILVTDGGTATVTGNTVSNNSDPTACGASQAACGAGIAVIPNGSGANAGNTTVGITESLVPSGSGNTVSGNDIGIEVAFNPAGSPSAVTVNGNTVSGLTTGVALANVGEGAQSVQLEANSISGSAGGAGLALSGVIGQTLGGGNSALGNNISGNGVGVAFVPGAGPAEDQGNLFEHNNVSDNLAIGVSLSGDATPPEFQGPYPTPGSEPNTFTANIWTGNGDTSEAAGANVLDAAASTVANTVGAPVLTLAADVPAGTTPTSFSISQSGATDYTIPMGTILQVGGASYGSPLSPGSANFYVAANTVIGPDTGPATTVAVTDLVPTLDTPFTIINAGNLFTVQTLNSVASTNVYGTLNSCKPDIGGSATLNAGSSIPVDGYYAC
jgi:hypothetical protein